MNSRSDVLEVTERAEQMERRREQVIKAREMADTILQKPNFFFEARPIPFNAR